MASWQWGVVAWLAFNAVFVVVWAAAHEILRSRREAERWRRVVSDLRRRGAL